MYAPLKAKIEEIATRHASIYTETPESTPLSGEFADYCLGDFSRETGIPQTIMETSVQFPAFASEVPNPIFDEACDIYEDIFWQVAP